MFRNYMKIMIRKLWKQKGYTFINLIGFTIGIASCLLIALYVIHESSYDNFHVHGDRIYRVASEGKMMQSELASTLSPPPAAEGFRQEFPEVEAATRFWTQSSGNLITVDNNQYNERRVFYADENFFRVFSFEMLQGDPASALAEPNSIVLTESHARKYFGEEPALGKTILVGSEQEPYQVTGVVSDVPKNSHFEFDILRSLHGLRLASSPNWLSPAMYTYIKLQAGATPAALEAKLPGLYSKYFEPLLQRFLRQSWEEFQAEGNYFQFTLQPLQDIHLHSNLEHELKPAGSVANLTIFSLIALFILLIACINFMNLTTARSADRAREVGVRKVVGSDKRGLFWQFMAESLLLSIVATLLAIGLVELAMKPFGSVTGIELTWQALSSHWLIAGLILLPILVGFMAGGYPAIYLAGFQPVEVLKGKMKSGKSAVNFRSGLVIFQFAVSIGLILTITLVYKQLNFMQQKNLGFDKENVLVIQETGQLRNQREAFRNTISGQSQVISASLTDALPAQDRVMEIFFRTTPPVKEGRSVQIGDEDREAFLINTDEHYLTALDLEIREGRNFSGAFGTDSAAALVNQAFVREFGWDNPVGRTFYANVVADLPQFQVVGVIEDYHMESMHEEIKPLVIVQHDTRRANDIAVRIQPGNISAALAGIQDVWDEFMPGRPMKFYFLDENFDALFRSEQQFSKIVGFFTLLAIFIAGLGAFGLAAFAAEQRTKEIGIRKALGATIPDVVKLLTSDFLKLVGIAFVIAVPVAYLFMQRWLQDFAYRIGVSFDTILITAVLALVIVFISVGWQSIRAATSNPTKSLRYE